MSVITIKAAQQKLLNPNIRQKMPNKLLQRLKVKTSGRHAKNNNIYPSITIIRIFSIHVAFLT